ncbi:hypothetical protein TRICI_002785 [Trichomonascus ciferrii]|uniref:LicD/FKTN/FKRP nucleotidyltransferase domain-containing protein n=1 Tax=Trichomonascus ciferrii TaxID=44093 RepID=A0A642V5R5_9ASCO|nr:hypothetical protein TRICI_002785 [Trichomonascus ciferrii]
MTDNGYQKAEFDSESQQHRGGSGANPLVKLGKAVGRGLVAIPTFMATKLPFFGMMRHSTLGKLLLMFASLYLIAVGSLYVYSGEIYPFGKDNLIFKSSAASSDVDPNQVYPSGFDPHAARLAMLENPADEQAFEWKDWMDLKQVEQLVEAANKTRSIWPVSWGEKDPFKDMEMPPKHAGTEEQQTMVGDYYLLTRCPPPKKVILLGDKRIVNTYSPEELERRKKEKENLKAQEDMDSNTKEPEDSKEENKAEGDKKEKDDEKKEDKKEKRGSDKDTLLPELASDKLEDKIEVHIPREQFIFNATEVSKIKPGMTEEEREHARIVKTAVEYVETSDKHFREVPLKNDRAGHGVHYDWRFFNKLRHGKDHEAFMHHLIRAWADFCDQENILSLISHGSLIGWYWNGMAMPWDADNDVQMPIMELDRFARKFNQTLVVQDPKDGNGRYLVDVSPWYVERGRGNGRNVIDARFIDIRSGIYLDITGLAITGAETNRVNCKNYHFYPISDISPARRSLYEGVNVYVPNAYESVLLSEYKSARKSTYGSWTYTKDIRLWVKTEQCQNYKVRDKKFTKDNELTRYGACDSDEIWKEFNNTREVTAVHDKEMDLYADLEQLTDPDSQEMSDQKKQEIKKKFADLLRPFYARLRYDPR